MNRPKTLSPFPSRAAAFAVLAACFLLSAVAADAQTVVGRARLGNSTEDITFVNKGLYKDSIAVVDGTEIVIIPAGRVKAKDANAVAPFKLPLNQLNIAPRGLAYVESESLFVYNDPAQRGKLFFCSETGAAATPRTIQYQAGFFPGHVEGLDYIPANSPSYPDHLVMGAVEFLETGETVSRLEIIRRDGVVVAEVIPAAQPADGNFVVGVAFQSPNRLVVSYTDASMDVLDFNGNVLASPAVPANINGFEGLDELGDGSIAAAGHDEGLLVFYDKNFVRTPASDRGYQIGFGISQLQGLAWNTSTSQHVVGRLNPSALYNVPADFSAASPFVDTAAAGFNNTRKMTYLPAEQKTAVVSVAPRSLLLYDNGGNLVETIDLSPAAVGPGLGSPNGVAYIPSTNQFAVRFNGPGGEQRRIRIIARTGGAPVRTIDLGPGSSTIIGLAFFNPSHPSGGQFLLNVSPGRLLVTDFNGNFISEFNARVKLDVMIAGDLSSITTGPQAGAFAILDIDNAAVVVFSLD